MEDFDGGLWDLLERRLDAGEVDCDLAEGDQDLDRLPAGEVGDLERLAAGEIGDLERCLPPGDLDRDLLDLEPYSFLSTGECEGEGDLLRLLEGLLEEWGDFCLEEDFFLKDSNREMSNDICLQCEINTINPNP